jgi:nucleoporin SEH1
MCGTGLDTRGEVTWTSYDTSGTRMATCTSEGWIHVWDRGDAADGAPGVWRESAGWSAHVGPAKTVAFAGAEFGQCLASSASDGTICVWSEALRAPGPAAAAAAVAAAEEGAARWERCASLRDGALAVSHLGFAPPEYGLQLAAAGDDGVVRFYSPTDTLALSGWELCNEAEALVPGAACTALAWCRPTGAGVHGGAGGGGSGGREGYASAAEGEAAPSPPMIVVGLTWSGRGGESDARVLAYDEAGMRWRVVAQLCTGPVAVTALAWAPNTNAAGGGVETIAAAIGTEAAVFRMEGYDGGGGGGGGGGRTGGGSGGAGTGDGGDAGGAGGADASVGGELRTRRAATLPHPAAVHGVDWNMVGNTLATSAGDGVVRVWAANMQSGAWEQRAQLVGE